MSALKRIDENYERLRKEHGITDLRFYVGEIKEATPEQFAEEANTVMEAFLNGKTSKLELNDSYSRC